MSRDAKPVGLVLVVAALAMLGAVAPAAQAAPVFTTSVSPVTVHGTGNNIGERIKVDGVTIECGTSHYTGSVTNGSSQITLTPKHNNCVFAGTGLTAHWTWFPCKFKLAPMYLKLGPIKIYGAYLTLDCPEGLVVIHSTGTSCEVAIGGQTSLKEVEISNFASDVGLKFNVGGITANVTKDGFLCPFNGTGTKTGGTYTSTGNVTLTASSGTLQVSGE